MKNREQGNNLLPVLFIRNTYQRFICKCTERSYGLFFVEQVFLDEREQQQDNQDDSLSACHPVGGSEY